MPTSSTPWALFTQKPATIDKARTEFVNILKTDPKNIKALWQMGVVEIMQDNAAGALKPLNEALSQAVQVDNQEQKSLILLAMGVSYRLLNKPDEAMRNYQQSMEISKRLGLKRILANGHSEMAQVQTTLGKPKDALASYTQALQILKEIGMKKEYGDTLIGRGVLYETGAITTKPCRITRSPCRSSAIPTIRVTRPLPQ